MKVVQRRAAELKPYPGNPRIPGQAVRLVAESIREFGWRQPIVIDEKDEIIVGHTRQLAAFKLEQEMVPVHVAEGLTEAQKRAYRLADNRLNEYATWDVEPNVHRDQRTPKAPKIGTVPHHTAMRCHCFRARGTRKSDR